MAWSPRLLASALVNGSEPSAPSRWCEGLSGVGCWLRRIVTRPQRLVVMDLRSPTSSFWLTISFLTIVPPISCRIYSILTIHPAETGDIGGLLITLTISTTIYRTIRSYSLLRRLYSLLILLLFGCKITLHYNYIVQTAIEWRAREVGGDKELAPPHQNHQPISRPLVD